MESSCTVRPLSTLARRVLDGGPLTAEEAVRLGARLCRAIEALHVKKERHGALSASAVRLPTEDLSRAVVTKPVQLQKRTRDDVDAIARLVHFSITGHETKARERPTSLGVFDVGDDALDVALTDVWSDPPKVTTVVSLRERFEAWLDERVEAMPWDERDFEPTIELSTLPPPPAALESAALRLPSNPRESFDFEEERPTLPGQAKAAPAARQPRLVPPKLLKSSRRKAAKVAEDDLEDEATVAEEPATRPWRVIAVFGVAALFSAGYAWVSTRDHAGAPARPTSDSNLASAAPSVSTPASVSEPPSAAAPELSAFMGGTSSANATVSVSASATPLLSASSASPAVSASASASADPSEATQRCIASALPEDTFAGTFTDLTPLCAQSSIVQGARDLRLIIVRAGTGRSVTAGMKEWSLIGSFELPAFAIIQNRCCAVAPVKVPSSPDGCPTSLETAIRALERSELSVKKEVNKVIDDIDRAIRCIERSGAEKRFGGYAALSGGEVTPFRKLVARLPPKPGSASATR